MFSCSYRKDYPNEVPEMSIRSLRGVNSKQLKELTEKMDSQAQELLGMQMLFPIAQLVKDWLDEQNMDNISKQKEAMRAKDELEIEKEKEVRILNTNPSSKSLKSITTILYDAFIFSLRTQKWCWVSGDGFHWICSAWDI